MRITGRASIAPEKLLRALLLQVLDPVRSERMLMEQMRYNLLFRWFVGLAIEDAAWDHSGYRGAFCLGQDHRPDPADGLSRHQTRRPALQADDGRKQSDPHGANATYGAARTDAMSASAWRRRSAGAASTHIACKTTRRPRNSAADRMRKPREHCFGHHDGALFNSLPGIAMDTIRRLTDIDKVLADPRRHPYE
jgi:hypothetical protein